MSGIGGRLVLCLQLIAAMTAGRAFSAEPQATIVVDLAGHASVQAAVDAAESVDWNHEGAAQAVCTQALAALELQHYLGKMTGDGADAFPIVDDGAPPAGPVILLGNASNNSRIKDLGADAGIGALEQLPPQGYMIVGRPQAKPATLVLAGVDRAGTLYAAYDFLDRLGVRWYAPGEKHEEVPSIDKFTIPALDISEKPDYETRGFWAYDDRGNLELTKWMGRNRTNFWTVEDSGRVQLKLRAIKLACGEHLWQAAHINPVADYPYNVTQFAGDDDKPADPYKPGDYQGDVNGDGRLSFSEVHPEWYGIRGGKRSFNIKGNGGDNYCDSNNDATTELMKGIVSDLVDGEFRYADNVNFWMLDGGKWCECAECAALGTQTDRNLILVHRLGQEIKKAQADKRIGREISVGFLSYLDVIEPPTKIPEGFDYEQCIVTYFPIRRCYVHTFDDPDCTEYNAEYVGHYKGWFLNPDRLYRGEMFIGEYYNVSRFNHLPLVLDEVMAADIPYYYQTGARHFHYMHLPSENWGTRAQTQWLMARLLWDTEIDVESELDDYFKGRYGPAADQMRAVYGQMRTAYSNSAAIRYTLRSSLNGGSPEVFTKKHLQATATHPATDDGPDWDEIMAALAESRRLLDAALKMDLPEDVRTRIAEDNGLCTYGERMLQFTDRLIHGRLALAAGDKPAARQACEEAKALAELLRADTYNGRFGAPESDGANGLESSRLEPALTRLIEDVE